MIQSSSSDAVSLTPKQANIYVWGWQRSGAFQGCCMRSPVWQNIPGQSGNAQGCQTGAEMESQCGG